MTTMKGNFAVRNGFDTTGRSSPLGATILQDGVNFSLFSRRAAGVELLFFDREDDARPARVISIDSAANRTYYYWHAFVPGVQPGQLYAYRVQGPCEPSSGLRFDAAKVLLDPYGRGVVVPNDYSREAARGEGDNAATAMKSVVVDPQTDDWEDDTPLQRPGQRWQISTEIGPLTAAIHLRASDKSGPMTGARGARACARAS